ncbi:MAG: hypothetical protein ACFB0G_12010 [Leptolyngbyaceae cyanobacterium]
MFNASSSRQLTPKRSHPQPVREFFADIVSPMQLAEEYGFERHHRLTSCSLEGGEFLQPLPSFLEDLVGDG